MNKYEFFHNELTEMVNNNDEHKLIEHYTWMSECAKFLDAVDYMTVIDKDAVADEPTVVHLFLDCDEFDTRLAFIMAEHSTEALHRKHRKSRRKTKVSRRKNTRWVAYLDGTAKECKTKNHRAIRREYDIPMGKGNFHHKIGCYEYFW